MHTPIDLVIAMRQSIEGHAALSSLTTLCQASDLRAVDAGDFLLEPGQPYREQLFLPRSGRWQLRQEDGATLTLEPLDLIGLEGYLDGMPAACSVQCLEAGTYCTLAEAAVRQLERDRPELFEGLNRLLAIHLRQHSNRRRTASGLWSQPARAIMQAPLATCTHHLNATQVLERMRQRRIGSLGVLDSEGHLAGLITFRSLAAALADDPKRAAQDDAHPFAETIHAIDAAMPLWQVHQRQRELEAKYLVVFEQQQPVGIVSQSDLLQALASQQRSVILQIHQAPTFEALEGYQRQLPTLATELAQHDRSAGRAVRALSELHLALQRRCIELALQEAEAQFGPRPSTAFAVLILGSGARREMLLDTDQDNALLIDNDAPAEALDWFAQCAEWLNQRLDAIGYTWCPGQIMACNADYRHTLATWCRWFDRIAAQPGERGARRAAILLDFDTLYGDEHLTAKLRRHIVATLNQQPRLLKAMVEDDAQGSPALGLFNRLRPASDRERRGRIDLKRNGSRILANAARILALDAGIDCCATVDRLHALVRQQRLDHTLADALSAAHDILLELALRHQLQQIESGEPPDKLLPPEHLSDLEESALRMAMKTIRRLQGRLQGEFGTVML